MADKNSPNFKNGAICFAKYKLANRAWMSTLGLYNLPIFDEREEAKGICHKISYFALYRQEKSLSTGTLKIYKARFKKEVSRKELLELNYPGTGNAHAKNYFLFEIEPVDCGNAKDFLEKDLAGTPQIVYLRDFTKGNCKEFAKKIESKDEKALEKLQKSVPYLVPNAPIFCVAEAYQMAFWDICGNEDLRHTTYAPRESEMPDSKIPFPPPKNPKFTFIDLFAGIGGFRIALQNLGGKCVFSSEWDLAAQKTYEANFGDVPYGDITLEETKSAIPDNFDILCGGFPCQAFSIAGYRKGFEDTRGTLFFDVAEIIKRKRPKAVFLENVKNLQAHDHGKTFQVIKSTLEELGYTVFFKVMNSMDYANVPQNRERIFIVCFDPKQVPDFQKFAFPHKEELTNDIFSCLDLSIDDKNLFYTEKMGHFKELQEGITDKNSIYQWRRQYVRQNKSSVCPTLTANMGTGGHNVPLILTDKGIRKLSPKECLNFQGYPENYAFPQTIANSSKYKQAGNSVVVPLIQKVCQKITDLI